MGIYDIAMLVVLGGAIVFGYRKGLAWQVASITALVVSYIVAVNFRDQVAAFIQAEPPWNRIGAMLGLFLATSLVIWTIYAYVSKSLKKHELKGFDRQAGALLGAVKGALLCMVITMFSVSYLGENAHNAIDNSRLGPYVEKGIWQVSAVVPEELARFVDPHIASYKEAVGNVEPTVNPGNLLGNNHGTMYPTGQQQLNQDTSQLPPANQTGSQSAGYLGKWLNPSSGENLKASNAGYQGGLMRTQPATSGNDWSGMNISEASKQILENARQSGVNMSVEAVNDAAQRIIDGIDGGQKR